MARHEELTGLVLCVVGARPNHMKMAPLLRVFRAEPAMPHAVLVHTGRHCDGRTAQRIGTHFAGWLAARRAAEAVA